MRILDKDISYWLSCDEDSASLLYNSGLNTRIQTLSSDIYLRGLIEISNICKKDCYYCGIRNSNRLVERFAIDHQTIVDLARESYKKGYSSIVIQSGEQQSAKFTSFIESVIYSVKEITEGNLSITLSLGEQNLETYKRWRDAGADRYLLRIETSDESLYRRLHPYNSNHSYKKRINALENIKLCDFQVGSGILIGIPWQNDEHLEKDLHFLINFDIDMCGMGPYIEHIDTPLYSESIVHNKLSLQQRLIKSLRMVALLRLSMPDINIASTTAMECIDPAGRLKALNCGANVIMSNITPSIFKESYNLYESKGSVNIDDKINYIKDKIGNIALNNWGDSLHYKNKK